MSQVARFLLLAVPALATALSVNTQSSIVTHYGCSTRIAWTQHNGPVPTSTVRAVVNRRRTIEEVTTITPVATLTGRPTTIIVTETATATVTLTEPTLTDTYSSTSTVDSTVITTVATITATETDDSGSTVSSTVTSTSTIPTPSGFVGVVDSTGEQNAGSGSKKRGRSLIDSSRQVAAERRGSPAPIGALPQGLHDCHPQEVLCTLTAETLFTVQWTRYAPTRTVFKRGPTITASSTSTATSTSTLIPSATTTVTVTTTSITTSSTTETDTSTVLTTDTVFATATTTLYAACATNNILGPSLANGQSIGNFQQYANDYGIAQVSTATTPYDCCVACQTDSAANCFGSYFDPDYYGGCLLIEFDGSYSGTCDSSYAYGYLTFNGPGNFTVSNGPCAHLTPPPA